MHILDWYGLGTAVLLGIVFYGARRIPVYGILCVLVVGLFVYMTFDMVDWHQPGEWVILLTGLILCSFGLLTVRIMLIRSVSLQLLSRLAAGEPSGGVTEDIGARLIDMEYFHLIRRGDANRLTAFGRLCSAVVAIFYTLFRLK